MSPDEPPARPDAFPAPGRLGTPPPAGTPLDAPRPAPPPPSAMGLGTGAAAPSGPAKRAGDSGIGRPPPGGGTPFDGAGWRPVGGEAAGLLTSGAPGNPLDEPDPLAAGFFLPDSLCRFLRGALLVAAAVAGVFLVTQTASFLGTMGQLPLAAQIALGVPLALCAGVIVWVLLKMLWLWRGLRTSPQIRLQALRELESRRQLRRESLEGQKAAVTALRGLLTDVYGKNLPRLRALGLEEGEAARLEEARARLAAEGESLPAGSLRWIDDFRRDFQTPLDAFALGRVRRYGVNAAVMAGVSPVALIDRLVVLAACLSMLRELLEIYALKPSWDKNLILMAKVIVSTYLAGVIDDVADFGVDELGDLAGGAAAGVPDFALRLGGKATAAAAKGYMVFRLGKAAIKALKPVA